MSEQIGQLSGTARPVNPLQPGIKTTVYVVGHWDSEDGEYCVDGAFSSERLAIKYIAGRRRHSVNQCVVDEMTT